MKGPELARKFSESLNYSEIEKIILSGSCPGKRIGRALIWT